ncbi:MAG: glycoside hydrolase family 31 protein [Clostridia bacterium]
MIVIKENKIIRQAAGQITQIEAFSKNAIRVRVTKLNKFQDQNWALEDTFTAEPVLEYVAEETECDEIIVAPKTKVIMTNGNIKVTMNPKGKLLFQNQKGEVLLKEYEYDTMTSLRILSKEMKSVAGDYFETSLKFHANENEKIYGMGQYQNGLLDLKGSFLELAQKNSQVSIPFMYSNLGYGFLWNNPSIGRATFGSNMTEWTSECTKEIDYWITTGDTPAEVVRNYTDVTGKPPVMPDYALGFWQSKLRYQTQDEVLEIARKYNDMNMPLDVIVIDYFHWTHQGTWGFDKDYWPDPKAMVDELKAMGTEVCVSIWPSVALESPTYKKIEELGYLIRTETGINISKFTVDTTNILDFTNPDAQKYVWNTVKENYYKYGIKSFWLDVAEPAYSKYDFNNYRHYLGSAAEVGNVFPLHYTKTFHDGLVSVGEKDNIISLVRCAWAGSQKYGALVWSGDVPSTFPAFKNQIVCGIHMGMAGIPWWNTDIGGFYNGNIHDEKFQELIIRWFQYGIFCPVARLHGNRAPNKEPLSTTRGGKCKSGADNEIWSYGEANCEIMKSYLNIRKNLKPYIRKTLDNSTATGEPVIRGLFYDFQNDEKAWDIKDEYLFGEAILVAPITEYKQRKRNVYLPAGTTWINAFTKEEFEGGIDIVCDAPIEIIPIFIKKGHEELLDCITL